MLFNAHQDQKRIREALRSGKRLVACLCAQWCSTCSAWHEIFTELANGSPNPNDCWVWIDIDESAEIVAEFDIENLPLLCIQSQDHVYFMGTILPKREIVGRLLAQKSEETTHFADPGFWQALAR